MTLDDFKVDITISELKVSFRKKQESQLKLFEARTSKTEDLPEKFQVVIYDEGGNLLGKGFNRDTIPLTRPVKPGETVDVRAYPLDKEGKYIPHLHDLLKMFMENQKNRIKTITDQNLTVDIDVKEVEAKGLTLKFRDTDSYKSLKKGDIPIFEVELEGRAPTISEMSFGEYLGWYDSDKVKAIFGGGYEEKRLYGHQYKALHELENSSEKKCIIVSSGMASGKTEIAVLYLLKAYKRDPDFGYAVVVYPTRELLRDQYGRWKRYFDSAYDLGYLSSPVEVVMYYGEVAQRSKGRKEREKIEKGPCVILTTASTFVGQEFLKLLKRPPRLIVLDEIHFYKSFDLTLLMEFLRFVKEGYKKFEKLMIFSATIGNAEEFKENLQNAIGMRCCLISGEPVRGRKTVYVIDLSSFDENMQEKLVDKVLKEYCKKAREKTIVFARNKREAEDYYYEKLLKKWRIKKYVKAVLHIGDMPMSERELTTEKFRIGKCKWVFTIKTLEVGIDIGDVSRIIHFGLPPSINEFTQREGRSGREGQESESIVFARTKGELEKAKKWVEELKRGSTELFCKIIFNPRSLLADRIRKEAEKKRIWPKEVQIGDLNVKCKVFGGYRFKLIPPKKLKGKSEVYTRDVLFRYLPYHVRYHRYRGSYIKLYVKTIKIDDERNVILDYIKNNHKVRENVVKKKDVFYATTSHLETIIKEEPRLLTSSLATVRVRFRPSHVNYIGRKFVRGISKSGEIIKVPRYYIMDSFSTKEAMADEDIKKLEKLSEDFTRGFVINIKVPRDIVSIITRWITEELGKEQKKLEKKEESKENLEEDWKKSVKKFVDEVLWGIGDYIHLALHVLINTVIQSENIHPDEIEHYVCMKISEEEIFRSEIVSRLAAQWGIDDKVRIVEELSPKLNIKIVIGNKSDWVGRINWNEKSLNEYLEGLHKVDLETILPLLEIHNCFVRPEEVLSFSRDINKMKGIICDLACEILNKVKDCANKLTVY